jgi:hypothetical protein
MHQFNAGEVWEITHRVWAKGWQTDTFMILNVDKPEHSIIVESVLNLLNLSDGQQHKISYRQKDSFYFKRIDNA